ncbi:MAG: head decoration protein [Clostridia bacterium]|nr:head decoration protein [Clostridia bacterium]
MTENMNKIGEMTYDGLITDMTPSVAVGAGTIVGGDTDTDLKRGALLSKGENGKLQLMKEGGNADCILCDAIAVKAGTEVTVPVYISGCFDPNKIKVAEGYTIKEADKDTLRTKGIVFKAAIRY